MKIVQPGEGHENWKATVTCQERKVELRVAPKPCGAVLEIEENDLILFFWRGTHGGKHYYAGFVCPCCGRENDLGGVEVPPPVWQRLREKPDRFDGFSEEL